MPVQRLTDPTIQRLTAKPGERVDYFDSGYPGLSVRVTGAADQRPARRVWTLHYRIDGKQKRLTLGTVGKPGLLPPQAREEAGKPPGLVAAQPPPEEAGKALSLAQAREEAGKAVALVRAGIDPAEDKACKEAAKAAAAKAAKVGAVEAVAAAYIANLKRRGNSPTYVRETERNIENHVLSVWRDRDIKTIARRDITERLAEIAAPSSVTKNGKDKRFTVTGGKVMANRVLAAIRGLFKHAIDEMEIDVPPIRKIEPTTEDARDHVLTAHEMRAVWSQFKALGYPYGNLFQLALVTGQRRGEVAKMKWAELDFAEATWTLQSVKTKSRRLTVVPLSKLAIEILAGLPRLGPFVFTGSTGKPIVGFSSALAKLTKIEGAEDVEHWTIHDLRRTCATELGRLEVPGYIIGKVLNHAPKGVTEKVYNRYEYLPEKREALEKWGAYLSNLTDPPTPNAVADLFAARERRHAAVS